MARPRKQTSFSPSQAVYILEKALTDRKLSSADIKGYLDSMHREISSLQERIAYLTETVMEPVRHAVKEVKTTIKKRQRKARRKAVSAEREASMKLQGEYLRSLRSIPERRRAAFKKMAKAEGREKAIAEMKKLIGK